MDTPEDDILDVEAFWRASKSTSYRALIRRVVGALVAFLQANGLTTRRLLREGTEIDPSFVMRRADLTEEGYEFYRRIEQSWFDAIDAGASPDDTSLLRHALEDLRRSSQQGP